MLTLPPRSLPLFLYQTSCLVLCLVYFLLIQDYHRIFCRTHPYQYTFERLRYPKLGRQLIKILKELGTPT